MKPLVAIVGRPNVGKSTFFNKVSKTRSAIVNNTPGVTRDRVYADADWLGYKFTLIDTGGIEMKSDDLMWREIRKQAEIAVELCDIILFMVDGKIGINPGDYDVADYLRKSGKPVILVVNKLDDGKDDGIYDFYNLNIGAPHGISSEHSLGLGDLLDEIVAFFPDLERNIEEDPNITKIAIVGKPNAGKSSLLNKILGYERAIVTDIPGTTRDAIDTPFERDGKRYMLIDTAGIRKKSKVSEDVEYYSVVRSISAIRRADIVLIVIDGVEMISEQDTKICGLVHDAGKPSIVVVNKWDAVEKNPTITFEVTQKILKELKFMDYLKIAFVSALTGKNVDKLFDTIHEVFDNSSRRIATGLLNDIIGDAIMLNPPPTDEGKPVRIYYSTQVSTNPPVFVFFVNNPERVHFSYIRYLENQLRKAFQFEGTPIKLIMRSQDQKE
jgi:GTPase